MGAVRQDCIDMRTIGGALDPAQVPKISYPRTVPKGIPGNLVNGRVILTLDPTNPRRITDGIFARFVREWIFSVLFKGPDTTLRQDGGRLQIPSRSVMSPKITPIPATPLAAPDRIVNPRFSASFVDHRMVCDRRKAPRTIADVCCAAYSRIDQKAPDG